MKKVVRINESDLTNIIKEALSELSDEGRNINNKRGYFDGTKPGNKYAQQDNKPLKYKFDNVVSSPKSWDELKDLGYDVAQHYDIPQNDFDVATLKHTLRQDRANNNIDNGGKVGGRLHRGAIMTATKFGIPMEIAYKLSFQTLVQINKELARITPGWVVKDDAN